MQELILQVKLFFLPFRKKESIIELVDLCGYFSKKRKPQHCFTNTDFKKGIGGYLFD